MRSLIFTFCLLILNQLCFAQLLPSSRTVNWGLAGYQGSLSNPKITIDFQENGGIPDGFTSNDNVIDDILNRVGEDPVVIFFPTGTYFFSKPIRLKSNIIIRGENVDSTILLFDLLTEDHLISVKGKKTKISSKLMSDANKESTSIELEGATSFSKGDIIYLFDDDADLITSRWALNSTGQVNQIHQIDENRLSLKTPLRRDYSVGNESKVVQIRPITNVGIETLTIKRLDQNDEQTSNVFFQYAFNCWIKCIRSIKCNFAHVDLRYSANIDISGSYFRDAFNYGGGGNGYGVMLQLASGDCMITDNIFEHLRHSMILQAGANGNVLSYNYSTDPYWSGVALPSNSAGDLVLHGNYPYANLFEGNTVQNVVIDNSHGINGKHNTFFRNRVELYGIFLNANPASDGQNFIGNEITNDGFLMGNYIVSGKDHFEYGNVKSDIVFPSGTQDLEETSLYLDEIPDHYRYQGVWPPIGLPNKMNRNRIEAEVRFHNNTPTKCSNQKDNIISVLSSTVVKELVRDDIGFLIYPNPASEFIQIALQKRVSNEQIRQVQILSANGTPLMQSDFTHDVIDIQHLSPGMYFVRILFSNNDFTVKKLIKKGM